MTGFVVMVATVVVAAVVNAVTEVVAVVIVDGNDCDRGRRTHGGNDRIVNHVAMLLAFATIRSCGRYFDHCHGDCIDVVVVFLIVVV